MAFSFVSGAQEKTPLVDASREADYLAELKEQLVLVWPKNKTINVVFHGHSVPSGYFKSPVVNTLGAYPHLFLKFLKENYISAVINCITTSIGGEQSEQGAKRFKDDVLCVKPDLLFIDYALNDRSIGLERSEMAWRSMIKEALEANVKIVLLTLTPDLKEDILDENAPLAGHVGMIKKLGNEYQIPVVDVYSQFKALKKSGTDISTYMSQGNHPNELGHQVVLDAIVNELFSEL
jgi:lysophospholipase L1-like esterase